MKKGICFLLALGLLTGCSTPATQSDAPQSQQSQTQQVQTDAPQVDVLALFSDRDYRVDFDKHATVTLSGSTASCDSDAVRIDGGTVTITDEGTYVITGSLEGMLIVDADKSDKTQIVLQNANITNPAGAPLYIRQADKVFITLQENTENILTAGESFTQLDDNNIDGAVFSKEDLTFNGRGKLTVQSPAGHGIVCKDSLHFTGGQYCITSASHGIAAKDELCIDGGSFELVTGKDGLHSENSDDTALGYLYIKDGSFDITAQGDGISANAWLRTDGGSYNILTGGGSQNGQSQVSPDWGSFGGGKGNGSRPNRPQNGNRPENMPPSQDITPSQGQHPDSMTPPQMQQPTGQTGTDSTSMKAIKAGSWLTINSGTFVLDSADDSLHSNGGMDLLGGSFQIASGDDAAHAEQTLTVTEGTLTVSKSYEGLEALHLKVYGGNIEIHATDDGLNAAGGTDQSGLGGRDQWGGGKGGRGGFGGGGNGSILIAGGELSITASGDALDANGSLEITGGKTTLCGPTRGDTAVLDYDRSGTISGGIFLGTGGAGMAQTLTGANQGVISLRVSNQAAATALTVSDRDGNILISHTPQLDYALVIFSSPDVKSGETYTVTIGNTPQQVTAR